MTKSYSVTLEQHADGEWHMIYDKVDYGPGHYPPLPIPEKDDGYFTFKIDKGSNFASPAIAVSRGNGKPSANHIDSQIHIKHQSLKKLEFSDDNLDCGPLNYVLYFDDDSTLDPIIDNGGGHNIFRPQTAQAVSLSYTSLAISGLVVLIIGGVIGWALGRA